MDWRKAAVVVISSVSTASFVFAYPANPYMWGAVGAFVGEIVANILFFGFAADWAMLRSQLTGTGIRNILYALVGVYVGLNLVTTFPLWITVGLCELILGAILG